MSPNSKTKSFMKTNKYIQTSCSTFCILGIDNSSFQIASRTRSKTQETFLGSKNLSEKRKERGEWENIFCELGEMIGIMITIIFVLSQSVSSICFTFSLHEWHMDDIRVHTSDEWYTSTYKRHTNEILVTYGYIRLIYE